MVPDGTRTITVTSTIDVYPSNTISQPILIPGRPAIPTITVTTTTTIDQCLSGPATQSMSGQPIVPGNPDLSSGIASYTSASSSIAPVPAPPPDSGTTNTPKPLSATTGGAQATSGGPEVPHGTDTALPGRLPAESGTKSEQSGMSGQVTMTSVSAGTIPAPSSNFGAVSVSATIPSGPASTSSGALQSSISALSATAISSGSSQPSLLSLSSTTTSSTRPQPSVSEFIIKLDLRQGVRVKITDGSIGPKASALVAAGMQTGPKVIELDAIKDQNKEIKLDLYTDRYAGAYLATVSSNIGCPVSGQIVADGQCTIHSTGGAQTYDASFTLQGTAYTGMSHGFIWLECGNDKFDPNGPPRIDLDLYSDMEITFTNPAMYFGKPIKQGAGKQTLSFGGLVKTKREKLEFDVAVLKPNNVRYNHKVRFIPLFIEVDSGLRPCVMTRDEIPMKEHHDRG